jgi:hypothetical protein
MASLISAARALETDDPLGSAAWRCATVLLHSRFEVSRTEDRNWGHHLPLMRAIRVEPGDLQPPSGTADVPIGPSSGIGHGSTPRT